MGLVGCGDEKEYPNEENQQEANEYTKPDGFEFSEDYLPSEVHVKGAEALGYTLMPTDGDKLLYKFHDDAAGVSEIYFVYRKPIRDLEIFSSVTVSLKLLNPFSGNHEELRQKYYDDGLTEAERIKTQAESVLNTATNSNSIRVKVHQSVGIFVNNVMTGDTWEKDSGILVETYDLYVLSIKSDSITDDNMDALVDSIYTYLDTYIQDYGEIVFDEK
jgi:hypothetical protein